MNHEDSFQNLVNHLFLTIRRAPPKLENGAGVDLALASGALIQVHLAGANVTLSAAVPLHRGYTTDFLLELLQINLNIDSERSIIVSALAAEELIVVWSKENISALMQESFVEYFDLFCHHVEVISKYNTAKHRGNPTSLASGLNKRLLT